MLLYIKKEEEHFKGSLRNTQKWGTLSGDETNWIEIFIITLSWNADENVNKFNQMLPDKRQLNKGSSNKQFKKALHLWRKLFISFKSKFQTAIFKIRIKLRWNSEIR